LGVQLALLACPTFWLIFAVPSVILAPVLVLFNFWVSWLVWYTPLRDKWLAKHGIAVQGKLTASFLEGEADSAQKCVIEYEFPVAGNRTKTVRRIVSPAEYSQVYAPEKVTVLYDPANPDRNVLYKFSRYRVVQP
jgi:hypothetical protein